MYVKRNVGEKKIKIKLKVKSYRVIREQTGQSLRTCVYNVSEKKKKLNSLKAGTNTQRLTSRHFIQFIGKKFVRNCLMNNNILRYCSQCTMCGISHLS